MVCRLNPDLSYKEIQTIIRTVINHKTSKLKASHIVNFYIPHIGRVKSHGNKKVRRYRPYLAKDKKKKKKVYQKLLLTKEKLLW